MTRSKRDSFDDLADFLRKRPVWAYRAGRVLNIIFGPAFYTKDTKVTPAEVFRMLGEIQKLAGPDAVGSELEECAARALAPKRKRGRPPGRVVWNNKTIDTERDRRQVDAAQVALGRYGYDASGAEVAELAREFYPSKRPQFARLVEKTYLSLESNPASIRDAAAALVLELRGQPHDADAVSKLLRKIQRQRARLPKDVLGFATITTNTEGEEVWTSVL